MSIEIIKTPTTRTELGKLASEAFGGAVKAVVDVERGIMAVGGEMHADEEILLMEREGSMREHIWGINLYPAESGEEWLEFDSMINLKPAFGNRTRGVDDAATRDKIKAVVAALISE